MLCSVFIQPHQQRDVCIDKRNMFTLNELRHQRQLLSMNSYLKCIMTRIRFFFSLLCSFTLWLLMLVYNAYMHIAYDFRMNDTISNLIANFCCTLYNVFVSSPLLICDTKSKEKSDRKLNNKIVPEWIANYVLYGCDLAAHSQRWKIHMSKEMEFMV